MSRQSQQTLSPLSPSSSKSSHRTTCSVTIPADDFINEDKLRDRLDCIYEGKGQVKECYWVTGHWVVEGTNLTKLNDVSDANLLRLRTNAFSSVN